jgi:hypothetical protein
MILNLTEEKNKINRLISWGVTEILKSFTIMDGKSMPYLEKDINEFMRAMQIKNKVYDYACMVNYDGLVGKFIIRVAYSLINSKEPKFQDEVKIKF